MITFAKRRLGDQVLTAIAFHARNAKLLLQQVSWWVLLVPAAIIGLIVTNSHTGLGWFEEKSTQEIVAPTVLAIAVFVAGLYWGRAGDFTSRWLLLLSVALFCRELHFWGTNNGIYLAVLLLLWYGSRHTAQLGSLLQSRVQTSLFVGALITYGLTKTFDRAYWSFLAGWTDWQDTMEESLETTAHTLVLLLITASYVGWGLRQRRGEVQGGPAARRLRVWAALSLVSLAAVTSAHRWYGEEPKAKRPRTAGFPVELSSLCNVAPQWGENLFLASSDEEQELTLWSVDGNGRPVVVKQIELQVALPSGDRVRLDDLEDIAWDGDQTYYAVSSHRHLVPDEDAGRRKKSRRTECALVRFQLAQSEHGLVVDHAQLVTQDLLEKIRELNVFPSIDWQRSKVFSWSGLVKTWQLDIEGLTCVDGKLLLGFKDPIERGRATILSYDPATDELAVAAQPDLNGHGILSLHFDAPSASLFVLSNEPIKHRYGDSCLWVAQRNDRTGDWSFSPDRKYVIESAAAKTRRKASGLTIRDDKLAVCFDSETESAIQVLALDEVLRR